MCGWEAENVRLVLKLTRLLLASGGNEWMRAVGLHHGPLRRTRQLAPTFPAGPAAGCHAGPWALGESSHCENGNLGSNRQVNG